MPKSYLSNRSKLIDINHSISIDDVLSELELVEVLAWYKRGLGKVEFYKILKEETEENPDGLPI